jgi:hypothetical protein
MSRRSLPEKTRVRAVTRAILLVGLASAALIYFANGGPRSASDYELERSKLYLHDLEVYGGKANVLADDFRSWFDGLWHGRSLALTVAVISVFTALVYRFVATPVPAADDRDAESEGKGRT